MYTLVKIQLKHYEYFMRNTFNDDAHNALVASIRGYSRAISINGPVACLSHDLLKYWINLDL